MGTTQRIVPGVTGEPNWSNLSNSITALANTIEKELDVSIEIDKAKEKEELQPSDQNKNELTTVVRQQSKLNSRVAHHFKNALKSLIRTGGGRSSVVKGKSASLGRAGIRTSARLSDFVLNVRSTGSLEAALKSIGFGTISGKTVTDVIDFLCIYFADVSAGMDDVAANMASCQILENLSEGLETVVELEVKMNSLLEGEGLSELICRFYGLYLFEHLSQRFQEKITQLKGSEVCHETFLMIKEDVIGQIKVISTEKSLSSIDWKDQAGKDIQEKIFDSIIQLFE